MQLRFRLASLLLLSLVSGGCFGNFDAHLYQAREDGGMTGTDAGTPTLALADFCTTPSLVPSIPRPASAADAISRAYLIDTSGLADDVSDVAACTGAQEHGPDGFASVMMLQNERWHFHLRRPSGAANAALYILDSSCDERTCSGGEGQDLCGPSADEHFSFVAPADGLYFLGVDSETPDGFTGELDVIHPVCGDGIKEHSEGCDGGDNCDAECRTELADGDSESESNDDLYSANHIILAATGTTSINGHIASACESDVFAFAVPAGSMGDVTVRLGLSDGACPMDDTTPIDLAVIAPDGSRVLTSTSLAATGGCMMVGGTASPLATLAADTYYVRIRSIAPAPDRPIDYQLSITPTFTP